MHGHHWGPRGSREGANASVDPQVRRPYLRAVPLETGAKHAGGGSVVRSFTLWVSFLFLFATVAAADELRGRVTDPQGQPVPHATVLVLRGTVVVATVTTTAAGQFGPLTLPAGDYEIAVSAPGLR